MLIMLSRSPCRARDGAAVKSFIAHSGANLPWIRYGWDLGAHPWGGDPGGFHVNQARLDDDFAFLARHGARLCRVFLFADFRTGLAWTDDGDLVGLDDYVMADMQALLQAAERHRLRLIPVLVDHTLADGISEEQGLPVGEHPEFFVDLQARRRLFDRVLGPFLEHFGTHPAIFAWELMNEPRFAEAVPPEAVRRFIVEAAALVRRHAPGKPVTIGHYDRYHHWRYGGEVSDIVQVHYYPHMQAYWNADTPASKLADKPVLFGEFEPSDVRRTLATALRNGYLGVLFWSLNAADGYDFRRGATAYARWVRQAGQGGGCCRF